MKPFMDYIEFDMNGGCWLWNGATHKSGYGHLGIRTSGKFKTHHAHRASWERHRGPIPDGLLVLHRCDVRPCVNPEHLFLGTHVENMADMVRKGRASKGIGEQNPGARLTADDVRDMRYRHAHGEGPTSIGKDYGLRRQACWHICTGRTWKHIEPYAKAMGSPAPRGSMRAAYDHYRGR